MQNCGIKKIILSGGGTGGSVTPLLAIKDIIAGSPAEIRDTVFLFIGTKNGPEKQLAESAGIEFRTMISGKLRRYWSWQNIIDLFKVIIAFWRSIYILLKEKPDLILSAGSFVSVPLAWAAWFLNIPVLIFQLDVRPGLANRLMAPIAKKILTVFEKSAVDYGPKALVIGNPIRKEFVSVKVTKREALQKIGLQSNLPVILAMGGGTGAAVINELVINNLPELIKFCQIIHITGKDKADERMKEAMIKSINYRCFEFLDTFGLIKAYAAADLIVSRAGMGSLTELAYVGKPVILIPMPDSHQEENAQIFEKSEAVILLNQKGLTGETLINNIKNIFSDEILRKKLQVNIKKVINTECEDIIIQTIDKLLSKEKA